MGVLERAMARMDGWANILTGLGTRGRDKREHAHVVSEPMMHREEMEALWEGDDMAARVVETWPREMTREGWTVKIQDDAFEGAAELLMARGDDLNIHHDVKQALEWERAYGGSAILVGADDGQTDLTQPLREDSIKSVNFLTVMAAYELHPIAYYADPQAPKFGRPMIYQLHPDAPAVSNVGKTFVQVHESRLIHFGGIVVSRRQQRRNNGWGDSVFIRVKKVLRDFDQSWSSAAVLLQDYSQAILKIKDLAELVATDRDNVVIKRAQMIDMQRSVARMVLLDAEEDFERKPTPMTGLPEMLERFSVRLAAAADMPVTLLMGQSPAGLQATGASDIRFFYDRVKSKQHTELQPKLKRLYTLLMLAKGSPTGGQVPDNWSIGFSPLWQLDDLQRAQSRLAIAQADQIYLTTACVSAEEVAVSRFGGDDYSMDTHIDFDARKSLKAATPPEEDKERPDTPPPLRSNVLTSPTAQTAGEVTRSAPAGGVANAGVNGGPT